MKKLLPLAFCFFAIVSCNNEQPAAPAQTITTVNYDWLPGEWVRTNDTDGKQTFENWVKQNDTTYLSHGFTMKGADTVWQEFATLSPVNNQWYLRVKMGKTDSSSTDFKVIEQGENFFNCENQQNDFPKLIKYKKSGQQLLAEISADTMKVNFVFEKKGNQVVK